MKIRNHWTKTKHNMIRMQEYIEAHLTENITAKGVAEQLGLNYQTVNVQFREFFGVGIGEYISDRRMERAAAELAGGAQVSMLLQKYHYATHPAFARAFRKHFGISAREYRNGVEPRRSHTVETVQELRRNPELYRQSSEYLELAFKAKHTTSAARDVLSQFGDYTKCASWAMASLAFCYDNGILDDSVLNIWPEQQIKRCEIAQMLYNMLSKANLL